MIGLLERVAGTIERYGMLTRGQRVGVAVSGGPDSVCLLHVLLELAARWDLRVSVVHVNHRLRGAESAGDAKFVEDLAAGVGLPFHLREADIAGGSGNLEQAAREARLAFFRETIESGAVDRVAVGHTRSDQAETVLFRFLRGSGTAGLAGIRPVTAEGVVRPLLEVDRSDVEEYLREHNLVWRDDSSNAGLQFARNRIRHCLLPQLAGEWNPGIGETLANTADWAGAEEAYWAAEIARLAALHLTGRGGEVLVRAEVVANLPLAVARRLVRHAIGCVRGDLRRIDFGHVGAILALAGGREGRGRLALPDLEVTRSFDWLRFGKRGGSVADYRIAAFIPGTLRVPGTGVAISLELIEKPETSTLADCVYNDEAGCLDWGSLSGSLELRSWQAGDRYRPVGSVHEEKIKTLFQRARIPLWERRCWPILVDGASIVWVRRFGPAAGFVASAGTGAILAVREILEPVGEFGIGIERGGV